MRSRFFDAETPDLADSNSAFLRALHEIKSTFLANVRDAVTHLAEAGIPSEEEFTEAINIVIAAGFIQADLARRLDVAPSTLNRWTTGESLPSKHARPTHLGKLCSELAHEQHRYETTYGPVESTAITPATPGRARRTASDEMAGIDRHREESVARNQIAIRRNADREKANTSSNR